ncbi:methyltransferase [Mangrovactinospora gilvigrisea]|uniref:Methyltransferase n=1 Tax=Mangrovactinospora gilvigrisea TaxID=1428644 RepID=A0A1J7C1Q0_9ACTN|nr:class I SAM-dependent methyltransferase [Mangrovactinospora gilvigrisea]OIV35508.1 methyltransferase [Mangrovactinospora gilvigrisea]
MEKTGKTGRIVNTEQAEAWNGREGEHWAAHRTRWDDVNEGLTAPLLDAARVGPGDAVLDIGCGGGRTTRAAARRAAAGGAGGRALGVDLSAPMLAEARAAARREQLADVAFEQGDAQVHPLPEGAFDAAVSRHGVMFFADPVAAFGNIRRALRAGGRLAFACAAPVERNAWFRPVAVLAGFLDEEAGFGVPGGPGMFSLAEPDRIREVLDGAGFAGLDLRPLVTEGVWGRDAEDAAAFLLASGPGGHLLERIPEAARDEARRAFTASLRGFERDGAVRMESTAWLVTARNPGPPR